MNFEVDPSFHMWFGIGLTVCAFYFFSRDKYPLEITSVVLLTVLLLFGQFFPIYDDYGQNMLGTEALLKGFANPSLIAVLALLVIGQAIVQTQALSPLTRMMMNSSRKTALVGIFVVLVFVMFLSAAINNTPVVIIAIPVVQALAMRMGQSVSRVMMPLSFAAILGGMTTLVGSSTNLLVSTALSDLGHEPFEFFDFTIPGLILAGVGMFYVLAILPRILPDRATMARELMGGDKQFIAELDIPADSKLVGQKSEDGQFSKLPGMSVRLIQRRGHLILPPFEDYEIQPHDVLIVAASREVLTDYLASHSGFLLTDTGGQQLEAELEGDRNTESRPEMKESEDSESPPSQTEPHVLGEVMITPASRLIDSAMEQIRFEEIFGCKVLGIQRRARVVRRRLGKIRLEAGDVLLISGEKERVKSLRHNPDLIVLDGSMRDIPLPRKAPIAGVIFFFTIAMAAIGIVPITISAIAGALLMLVSGCLNIRQATRAIDRKIFLLVGSALALGTTLQVTHGAAFLAQAMLEMPIAQTPLVAAMLLFVIVAIATNLLSNNACAVLFTPIALNLAEGLGVDPFVFAVTVVFAANCSFASPIGYQTNLLVMGPGHYQFKDFMRAGIPLIVVITIAYGFLAKYYFGL